MMWYGVPWSGNIPQEFNFARWDIFNFKMYHYQKFLRISSRLYFQSLGHAVIVAYVWEAYEDLAHVIYSDFVD